MRQIHVNAAIQILWLAVSMVGCDNFETLAKRSQSSSGTKEEESMKQELDELGLTNVNCGKQSTGEVVACPPTDWSIDPNECGFEDAKKTIPKACPPKFMGDANNDGDVNMDDFGICKATLGQAVPPRTGCDFDADGKVTLTDFGTLKFNFGKSAGGLTLYDRDTIVGPIRLYNRSYSYFEVEVDTPEGKKIYPATFPLKKDFRILGREPTLADLEPIQIIRYDTPSQSEVFAYQCSESADGLQNIISTWWRESSKDRTYSIVKRNGYANYSDSDLPQVTKEDIQLACKTAVASPRVFLVRWIPRAKTDPAVVVSADPLEKGWAPKFQGPLRIRNEKKRTIYIGGREFGQLAFIYPSGAGIGVERNGQRLVLNRQVDATNPQTFNTVYLRDWENRRLSCAYESPDCTGPCLKYPFQDSQVNWTSEVNNFSTTVEIPYDGEPTSSPPRRVVEEKYELYRPKLPARRVVPPTYQRYGPKGVNVCQISGYTRPVDVFEMEAPVSDYSWIENTKNGRLFSWASRFFVYASGADDNTLEIVQ